MRKIRLYILLIVAGFSLVGLPSCSGVRDARTTIAQADSLLLQNVVYEDSLSLAQAVDAMRPWQLFAPTDYAKACFYYGRLLRSWGYYAEAMPYLINARRARTSDHELLGRVYSNIAYMCRLEGNYPLAHEVYTRSAEEFRKAGDSLRYHTGCVNMAYALAEQGDTTGVKTLLEPVEQSCSAEALAWMTRETYAEAFMRAGDFAHSLRHANSTGEPSAAMLMIKAQCFSGLEQPDSAT